MFFSKSLFKCPSLKPPCLQQGEAHCACTSEDNGAFLPICLSAFQLHSYFFLGFHLIPLSWPCICTVFSCPLEEPSVLSCIFGVKHLIPAARDAVQGWQVPQVKGSPQSCSSALLEYFMGPAEVEEGLLPMDQVWTQKGRSCRVLWSAHITPCLLGLRLSGREIEQSSSSEVNSSWWPGLQATHPG